MTRNQLRRTVTRRLKAGQCSLRGLLRTVGLHHGHTTDLSAFLRGEKAPTPALLKALGYRRVQAESYVRDK